jgi:hypothetical protein
MEHALCESSTLLIPSIALFARFYAMGVVTTGFLTELLW